MSKPIEVSIGPKIMGNLFKREHRALEVKDQLLAFSTVLEGKWPDTWEKKEISITDSPFNMLFKVTWKDGTKATFSTYTKKTYLRTVLPYIVLATFGTSYIAGSTANSDNGFPLALVGYLTLITAIYAAILYIPYRRLKRELKLHGYLS